MASILAECTECGGQSVGFEIARECQVPGRGDLWYTLLFCGKCRAGLMVKFLQLSALYSSPMKCPGDPTDQGNYHFIERYPEPMPSSSPEHVPDSIAGYFIEASDNCKRAAYTSSGMMSRKVMDVSTKRQLGADASNYHNNKTRIDALATKGLITIDLQDWAHHVRIGGNDAAHDDDPFTLDEAKDLLNFTELYLTYVYTLPGWLRARRALPPSP
jgi:hypothetical protein